MCSHSTVRGRSSFYLFALSLMFFFFFFWLLFFFPPLCWYEDFVGVYTWQTLLEALIIVVVCVYVGLWSSGLCKLGSCSISFTANLQDFDEMGLSPIPWCVFKLMNRCDGGGHFVWQPQEDEDTSVLKKKMPAVTGFSQVPSLQWLMVLTFCSLLWGTLLEPPFFVSLWIFPSIYSHFLPFLVLSQQKSCLPPSQ